MRVQTFRSEFAIERFDEGVFSGLARPGEVERDIALISPQVEITRDELGALIDADCREPDLPADLFAYLHNIRTAEGEPRFKGSETYNQGLSERRADAVKRFLLEQYGIDAGNLVTVGYGKTHLKNPAEPLSGENRRVQVINATDK
jgi:OmpA family